MLIKLHSQATTTPKVRAAIQESDEPAWVLAERHKRAGWACGWFQRDMIGLLVDLLAPPRRTFTLRAYVDGPDNSQG